MKNHYLTTFCRIASFILILNCFFTAIAQTLPDYFIENVTVDTTQARKGETVQITYDLSVDNPGFIPSVRLYLSEDESLSTGDILVATWNPSIGANQQSFTVPTVLETGTKNVILVANRDFNVRESNYSNNVATANTTLTVFERVLGDLRVEDWQPTPVDVIAGEVITSTITVSDTLPSQFFNIAYFLSEDSVYDTDDYPLGISTGVFASNPPGSQEVAQLIIPSATNPGTWQLLAYLDVDGAVRESDESNNLAVYEIFVNPIPTTNFIISSTTIGAEFLRGQFATLQYVVSETENVNDPSTTSALYLSRDSIFSTDDRLLATDLFVTPENTESINFTVPQSIDTGLYQLLIVADHELNIKETDEKDNVGVHQIRVIPTPRPDLVFEEILFNNVLSSGQNYGNQTYSYSNLTGIAGNTNVEISFYLSLDSNLDNTDILLFNNPSATVPATTAIQSRLADFTMKTDIDSGEYLLLGYLDFIDRLDEEDELNNDTIIAITVVNPDLTIGELTSTETVSGAGLSIPLTVRVDNISETNGYAAPSTLHIYLSEDELPDVNDLMLTTINIGAIDAGFTTNSLAPTITFPRSIEAREYFLVAFADPDSLLAENVEVNNWSALPITIQLPDLQVKGPIINPSTITAGKQVSMEFRVDNNALIPAPQSTVKLFLSADEVLDIEEDYLLGTTAIEAIGAQGSSTDKIVNGVFIPEIEQGDYKVLFVVDADSLISESNETNNVTLGDITLTNPDIFPLNLDLSRDLVGSGETTVIDFVFSNQGAGDIDATAYAITLAGDNLQDEILLGSGNVAALVSSATSSLIENTISIPSYIERGDYYVKVYADWFENELESDEINNVDSILLKVTNPDLTLSNVIASPNIISVGFPTTIDVDIENIGRVNAPATSLSFVLSLDNTIDETDYFYNTIAVSAIDSLSEITLSTQLTIPSFINPGQYVMILDVDPFSTIPELNEENNRITVGITVKVPDLSILNQGLDKTVVGSSELLEIEARVTNRSSDAKAPGSTLAYYLSENNTLDEFDIPAGSVNVEALELGATSTNKVINFEIPAYINAGNYHILFSADDLEQVNETDEANNVVSLPFEITNPDLIPSNLVLSKSSLELSEVFTASVQVTNSGDSKAASGTLHYYLSTEELALNDSSIYLGNNFHDPLNVGQDTVLNDKALAIPNFLDFGDYNLLVFVDPDSTIAEVNEGNNIISAPINLLYPDLTTINQELDKASVSVGDTLKVTYNLKNNGVVDSRTSITGFYLAGEDTIALSAYNEAEAVVVASGTAPAKEVKIVIPFSVNPGDYQLAIRVDAFNNNVESNEDNNIFALDVTILPIDLVAVSAFVVPAKIEPDSTNQTTQLVGFTIEATSTVDPSLILADANIANGLTVANVYISSDDVYDEEDRLLLVGNRRALITQDELNFAVFGDAYFPYDMPKGDQFALIQLDGFELLEEGDENNNFIAVPITYGNSIRPDFVAQDQQVIPSKLTVNKEVTVLHYAVNDGASRVSLYDNGIFLSNDELLDVNDVLLSSKTIQSTGIGFGDFVRHDLVLEEQIPEGISQLLGVNDPLNSIKEQNEDNNAIGTTIEFYAPLPIDFTPTCSSQLPELVLTGDSFDFVHEVENLGTGIPDNRGTSDGTNYLSYSIYLSADDQLSGEDLLLSGGYTTAVSPHDWVSIKSTLTVPNDLAAGTYYVIVEVDDLDEYEESDETNNALALAINVQEALSPDLIISYNGVTTAAQANTIISANMRISNLGGSDLEDVSVSFYLSEINVFSEELEPLQMASSTLNIGAYQEGINRVFLPVIPYDTEPGRYVLFAKIDSDDQIIELNEDNNIAKASIQILDAVAPDFMIERSTESITAYQGEVTNRNYSVSYFVVNNGTKADQTNVAVYFSLDDVFDGQDNLLTTNTDVFVNAGGQTFSSSTFTLPNLLAGNYTIFLVADPQDELLELDEDDNVTAVPLNVLPPSKPDLTPENGLSVSNNVIGLNEVIEVFQTIRNLDRGQVDSVLVRLYISTDPTVSGNDLLLSEFYSPIIAGFGALTVGVNEVIPTSLSMGDYFLISVLDEDNTLSETNEANNEEYIAITLTEEVQPDLIGTINSISSAAVSANTVLNVNYGIFNGGQGAALEYEVSFYLSRNDIVDATDLLLVTNSLGLLRSGSNQTVNASILIPANVDPGDYNLILLADPQNALAEEDETNNSDQLPLEILSPELPDLTNAITTLPTFVNARQVLDVTVTTHNIGLGVAAESTLTLYISEDDVLDAADVQIGSDLVEQLLTNSNTVNQLSITIPDLVPGNYFVISVNDEGNVVEEVDENNNVSSVALEVGEPIFPDLAISSLAIANPSVNAGNDVTVTAQVDNIGDNRSDETVIAFYLSNDEVFDATDVVLGTEIVDPINSQNGLSIQGSFTIPNTTTVGNYFVLARVNPDIQLEESDYGNNINSGSLEVLERLFPDLEATFASVQPTAIPAGQSGNLSVSIFNFGEGSSTTFVSNIYLSTDASLSAEDVLLTAVSVDPIQFGASAIVQASFTIPANTVIGSYELIIVLDANGAVQETDETNNIFNLPVTILESLKADLIPQSLALNATSINAGGTIGVSFEVLNQGQITSQADEVGVYFSTDDLLDASDELITTLSMSPLNANSRDGFNASVPVPLDEVPGNYFIIVQVDNSDLDVELDELNNTAVVGVEVTAPLPGNLTVSQLTVSQASISAGQQLEVSVTIANTTTNAVLPYTTGIYLSADATFSNDDVLLATESFGILAGQGTANATIAVTPSATLEPGNYFIIARVDDGQVVFEMNENDNNEAVSLEILKALAVADEVAPVIVYPNPSTDYLNIVLAAKGENHLLVVDISGKIILEERMNEVNKRMDITTLPTGEYFLLIETSEGEEWKLRFIKQ